LKGNRITRIQSAGTPGVQNTGRQGGRGARAGAAGQAQAPAADGTYVLDATGMYLMPGFIDMHVHAGGAPKNADAEYAYKLWLRTASPPSGASRSAITTITVSEKARSEKNEIVAPRIINFQRPGQGWPAARSRRRRKRANGCAGARPTASTD
jgi:hypothetical protein